MAGMDEFDSAVADARRRVRPEYAAASVVRAHHQGSAARGDRCGKLSVSVDDDAWPLLNGSQTETQKAAATRKKPAPSPDYASGMRNFAAAVAERPRFT